MISFFYGEVFDMNINSDLYINFKEEIQKWKQNKILMIID